MNEYGYFFVRLYCTGLGFQANIVEEYVPLSASQHEEVSSLLSVPKDLSGLLSVIPIALFGSEVVRVTSSLLLSFLVRTTHSEPFGTVRLRHPAGIGELCPCRFPSDCSYVVVSFSGSSEFAVDRAE